MDVCAKQLHTESEQEEREGHSHEEVAVGLCRSIMCTKAMVSKPMAKYTTEKKK